MRTRRSRLALVIILVAVGVACGTFLWLSGSKRAAAQLTAVEFDGHIGAVLATMGDIGSAQGLYVAPGQAGGPWPARVTTLFEHLSGEVEGLRASGDPDLAASVRESVDRLVAADAQVRQQLSEGNLFGATDKVSTTARETLTGALTRVRDTAELARGRRATDEQTALTRELAALGSTALLWLVGLVLLSRVQGTEPATAAPDLKASDLSVADKAFADGAIGPDFQSELAAVTAGPPLDMQAAAEVSAAIARLTDAAQIQDVLAHAAEVLDARGAIVWLNTGDRLQAVAAYGYDQRVLARVGAIDRDAQHVTAEAWRESAVRTVTAPDAQSAGAIVAPMVAYDGCRGVLSLEVRHGRENDLAARGVAAMFASQLAGVLTPAPAPTEEPSPAEESVAFGDGPSAPLVDNPSGTPST